MTGVGQLHRLARQYDAADQRVQPRLDRQIRLDHPVQCVSIAITSSLSNRLLAAKGKPSPSDATNFLAMLKLSAAHLCLGHTGSVT